MSSISDVVCVGFKRYLAIISAITRSLAILYQLYALITASPRHIRYSNGVGRLNHALGVRGGQNIRAQLSTVAAHRRNG